MRYDDGDEDVARDAHHQDAAKDHRRRDADVRRDVRCRPAAWQEGGIELLLVILQLMAAAVIEDDCRPWWSWPWIGIALYFQTEETNEEQ